MTKSQLIEMASQADHVEFYRHTDRSNRLHSDYIRELDITMDDLDEEVDCHFAEIMDEDEYNSSILANSSIQFSDIYESGEKVLVVTFSYGGAE